jgi:hypothetical protein
VERYAQEACDFLEDFGFPMPSRLPRWNSGQVGSWSLRPRMQGYASSYLAETALQPAHSCLSRGGEVWMCDSLLELESHAWHVHRAHGSVLVGGLGMGLYAALAAAKPTVARVLVTETDREVVELFRRTLDQNWPGLDKIRIVQADVTDPDFALQVPILLPDGVDCLYVDIWPDYPNTHASAQTSALARRTHAHEAGWWGQELGFADWCANHDRMPEMEGWHEWCAHHCLPATANAGYLRFIRAVAAAHGLETAGMRHGHSQDSGLSHHLAVMQPEVPTTQWEETTRWVAFSALSCSASTVMSCLAARFGGTLYLHEREPGRRVEPQPMLDDWMDKSTPLLADMAAQAALAALVVTFAQEGIPSLDRSAASVLSMALGRALPTAMFEPNPDDVMAAGGPPPTPPPPPRAPVQSVDPVG